MNQFKKVAMLVTGLAFGSIVYAARVEIVKSGIYITLSSDFKTQTNDVPRQSAFTGKGKNGLQVIAISRPDPSLKKVSITDPA